VRAPAMAIVPTHSTTVSFPELTAPAYREKTDSGSPPRHDINQAEFGCRA
jgi:hypothetical protein